MSTKLKEIDLGMIKLHEVISNPKAVFFCSHSGGKDSQAMYIFLREVIPAHRLIVIHSDLGEVEWPETFSHIQKYVTHETIKVQSETSFFDLVRERKMFPSGKVRTCTNRLKVDVIMAKAIEIMKQRGFTIGVNCMGLRAEESTGRAGKAVFSQNTKYTSTKRTRETTAHKGLEWFNYNPIHTLSTEEVYKLILSTNEQLHPAYYLGMSRLSCRFCIMANRQDIAISSKANPELLEKYAALEIEVGHTMFMHQEKPISIKDFAKLPYVRAPKKLIRLADCMGSK
jgi:DNA sulfur modification protein DndC